MYLFFKIIKLEHKYFLVSEYKFLKQLDYNYTVKSTLKDCALHL